jgi:hypothetical protein
VNSALRGGETGTRHYLRGLILEARADMEDSATPEDDRLEAMREYEWVLAWSQVYPYSFFQDARRRLTALKTPAAEPTPTPE